MKSKELFRAENLPVLQNKMFATAEAALNSPTGDVVLIQDQNTGLIYNAAFDSSKLTYDMDYQNEQACSSVFQRHLEEVFGIVLRHFQGQSLIEVGCGKGYFLEFLLAKGFSVTGIDPAYEGSNPKVVKAPFVRELGLSADGLILRHVLEHIENPLAFLASLAQANGGKGIVYIEVPCFDWICRNRVWFDIFYEHVNYFRLQDFHRIFGRVFESGHVFGGQYLYVLADLSSLRTPDSASVEELVLPDDFLAGVDHAIDRIRARPQRRNVVWGGASKGLVFSLYMQRAGIRLDAVVDINPAKQGRYLAGSGLRVSSPEEVIGSLDPADHVFVMNSNYRDEIVRLSGNKFTYYTVDHE